MFTESKRRLTGQIAEARGLCARALDAMMTSQEETAVLCLNNAIELLLDVQRQSHLLLDTDGPTSAMC